MQKYAAVTTVLMFVVPAWAQHPQGTANPPTSVPTPVATAPRVDAPHRLDPSQAYYRCYAVVPIVGTGKPGDPKRPMFAPLPGEIKKDHSGILGFRMVLSDDHTMALVEFVGANRAALGSVLSSAAPTAKIFERGLTSKAAIEAEFQKHKAGFTLDSWSSVRAQ